MSKLTAPENARSYSSSPEDQPIQSVNSDMNKAIIAAIALGIVMFIVGFIILKTVPYTDANYAHTLMPAHVNGQPVKPDAETLKPTGDVSNVGNQQVSGDTLIDNRIGNQR